MALFPNWLGRVKDAMITVVLWIYYTLGFVVFFAPFYVLAWAMAKDPSEVAQRLNSRFYRTFFLLLRFLVPACRWQIDDAVKTIRGSVVVANHLSYLDSILLISLFPRHTTIAKQRLFHIPILGWVLRISGYLPSSSDGRLAEVMISRMERMPALLAEGGNLLIFPEGTRSRSGAIGTLNTGAFKIARMTNAPIDVVRIDGTANLFKPGRFLFDTCSASIVRVRHLAHILPEYKAADFSREKLMADVREILKN